MLNRKNLFSYAFLAFPVAFASLPIYIFVPTFYALHYGLKLSEIGVLLLLIRLIDAFAGPLMGWLSDRCAGIRSLLFVVFAVLFIVGFVLLFNPISTMPRFSFVVGLVVCALAYSFYYVNLNAVGAIWSDQLQSKIRISAWREAFGLFGVVVASLLPAFGLMVFSASYFYFLYSVLFSVLLVISITLYLKWYRQSSHRLLRHHTFSGTLAYFRLLTRDQVFFYSIYFFSACAMACTTVLIQIFVKNYLQLPSSYLGGYLFVYFLAGLISIQIWKLLGQKFGVMRTWQYAMLLLLVCFLCGLFLKPGDALFYGAICLVCGFVLGAELILPTTLLAVLVDNQEQSNLSAGYFSMIDFITKLALSIASVVLFGVLEASGYQVTKAVEPESLSLLLFLYILVPCLLKLIAFVLMAIWRRSIKEEI